MVLVSEVTSTETTIGAVAIVNEVLSVNRSLTEPRRYRGTEHLERLDPVNRRCLYGPSVLVLTCEWWTPTPIVLWRPNWCKTAKKEMGLVDYSSCAESVLGVSICELGPPVQKPILRLDR